MVVGNCVPDAMDKSQAPPTDLKFGMDRILSNNVATPASFVPMKDLGSSHSLCSKCTGCAPPQFNGRSCRLASLSFPNRFFNPSIYVPQPLRPFTNVVIQSESHVEQSHSGSSHNKRKRSWSRAVFSNLQRKGLEKRFQLQKYITKPDRRQLAATLGLTDAQVKVWFQNRRMKWRHAKETSREDNAVNKKVFDSDVTSVSLSEDSTHKTATSESDSESDIDVQTIEC